MNKELNWLFDYSDLKVYQYKEGFKFSLDSILLAEFVEIRPNEEKIIDLCTGNAVIPIILQHRYHKKIFGIELQEEVVELARDSVKENHMQDNIEIIEDSVLNVQNYFPGNNFDVVVSNPPYFKYHNNDFVNDNKVKSIARHEITMTLEELMKNVSYLLKDKGRFYLVHIPERIAEIIQYASEYHLALKKMQFISSKKDGEPIIVLVCLVKNGRSGCKVEPQIAIGDRTTYQNIFRK